MKFPEHRDVVREEEVGGNKRPRDGVDVRSLGWGTPRREEASGSAAPNYSGDLCTDGSWAARRAEEGDRVEAGRWQRGCSRYGCHWRQPSSTVPASDEGEQAHVRRPVPSSLRKGVVERSALLTVSDDEF